MKVEYIPCLAAAAALGFACAATAPAAKADPHGGITVGGWIEVIGGTADNDGAGGVDGISRGFYSRISVSYDNTLDNGLEVAGRIAYQLNQRGEGVNITASSATDGQRMDASTNYDPDVLYISVGGGSGTLTVGAAAPASCSLLPRPVGFVNGVDATYYEVFSGLEPFNATFSEFAYCDTPEQVSYATPTLGGFTAMMTYAPDHESNQGTPLKAAQGDQGEGNLKDHIDIAASWETSMGAAGVSLGVGYQQGQYQGSGEDLQSASIAGTVGFGGITLGAAWYDTEEDGTEHGGHTLAAAYETGSLAFGATWSSAELDDGSQEDSAFVLGASYAVGGGLTAWLEYLDLETDCTPDCADEDGNAFSESDSVIIAGVTLGF